MGNGGTEGRGGTSTGTVRRIGKSFSIRQPNMPTAKVAEEKVGTAVVTATERLPRNASSILIAWKEFTEQLPQDEAAMAQRMRGIEPILTEDTNTFEVIANNALVEQELNHISQRIEQYINQRIEGGNLGMSIRLRKATDKKLVYDSREQFQIMCKENEALLKLQEAFGLELV